MIYEEKKNSSYMRKQFIIMNINVLLSRSIIYAVAIFRHAHTHSIVFKKESLKYEKIYILFVNMVNERFI